MLPGRSLLTWQVPELARRAGAGQFLHLLAPTAPGLLLPVLPVAGFDRSSGTLATIVAEGSPAAALLRLRVDDVARFDGPFGHGFEVDPRSRNLLVACDAAGFGLVRGLLDEATQGGRQVTLLLGAGSAAGVIPSTLLPDEVEYVVATADGSLGHTGSLGELVVAYEAWADQCLAAGPTALLEHLAVLARGRDERLGVARLGRRPGRLSGGRTGRPTSGRNTAWLQVALAHDIGCALGVCLGCVVEGAAGPLRLCREGPVVDAQGLAPGPGR